MRPDGSYGSDGSSSAFPCSRDINSDLSEATEPHCCDIFNDRRARRLNPLVLARVGNRDANFFPFHTKGGGAV